MKYKIEPICETAMVIDDVKSAEDAMAEFAGQMSMDMNCYFRAVPLDPERRCGNCANRFFESMFGNEPCGGYEMAKDVDEEIDTASECSQYMKENPDNYCPSVTAGDYSPSNPWDAPGMSVRDFI